MKNKKLIVLNSIVLGLSFLATLFMFVLPVDANELPLTAFNFARLLIAEGGEGLVFAIPLILATIFGIVTVAFSVLGLLNSLGIIKKAKGYYITDIVLSSVGTFFVMAITGLFAGQGYIFIPLLLITLMFIANIVLSSIILSNYKKALRANSVAVPAPAEAPVEPVAEPVAEDVNQKAE